MNLTPLEDHPIAAIFPLLPEPELASLTEDVKAHGVQVPIVIYEGKILDGRNRYRAAMRAGEPFVTNYYTGNDPVGHVVSLNLHRRHLSESQRQLVAAKIANMEHGGDRKSDQRSSSTFDISANKAADMLNVGRTGVVAARKILRDAPEHAAAIERGEKTVTEVRRELRRAELSQRAAALPNGKFRVLYADPPWKYGDNRNGLEGTTGAEAHYPTMTIAELCALDIRSLADDNAVLFLWTTSPLLFECAPVIQAWGFHYKTSFVWDKVRHNLGHYNSVRHEFLLVCTRGSCLPDAAKLFDSVQSIERNDNHSEKPEQFRQIIETLYPNGRRLELFARKPKEGWEVYGNECCTTAV